MSDSLRAGAWYGYPQMENTPDDTRHAFKTNHDLGSNCLVQDIEDLFVEELSYRKVHPGHEKKPKVNGSQPTQTGPTRVPARRLDKRGYLSHKGNKMCPKTDGTCSSETPGLIDGRSLALRLNKYQDAQIAEAVEPNDIEVLPTGPRAKIVPNSAPGSPEEKDLVCAFWDRVAENALPNRGPADWSQERDANPPGSSNVQQTLGQARNPSSVVNIDEQANTTVLNDGQTERRPSVMLHEFRGILRREEPGQWSADIEAIPNQARLQSVRDVVSSYHETDYGEEHQSCAEIIDKLVLTDVGLASTTLTIAGQHIGQPSLDCARSGFSSSPDTGSTASSMTTAHNYYDDENQTLSDEEDDDSWWDQDDDPATLPSIPPYYSLKEASNSTASTRPFPTRAGPSTPGFNPNLADLNSFDIKEPLETPTRPPSPHGFPSADFQQYDADGENEGIDGYEYTPAVTEWVAVGSQTRRYTKFPDDFRSDEHLKAYYHSPESALANGTPTRAQEVMVNRALYPARRRSRYPNRKEIVIQKATQSPTPSQVPAASASRNLNEWQQGRIAQLQSMDKKQSAKHIDERDEGVDADTEHVRTKHNSKEDLKELVEIIKRRDVPNGSNKRRRLSFDS